MKGIWGFMWRVGSADCPYAIPWIYQDLSQFLTPAFLLIFHNLNLGICYKCTLLENTTMVFKPLYVILKYKSNLVNEKVC